MPSGRVDGVRHCLGRPLAELEATLALARGTGTAAAVGRAPTAASLQPDRGPLALPVAVRLEVGFGSGLFTHMTILKTRARALAIGASLLITAGCSGQDAVAGPVPATPPPPAPWVLFQQDAGSRLEVAMVRTDGTDLLAPLHDLEGGDQTNPDWSPDGTRIVFVMNDGQRDDLWVADADGSHARMMLDCAGTCRWLDDPDWSPDGTQVVYSRTIERTNGWGVGTLETVDVATGKVRVVLGPWKTDFTAGARYAPDGSQVVFEKVHKTGRGPDADIDGVVLTVVRLDRPNHPTQALTEPDLFAATADWSPDGRRIVYSALAEPGAPAEDLFWIRPDGGVPTRLTHVVDAGGYAREPAWHPDGTGVLFSGLLTTGTGSPELLEVGVDGGGLGSAFGDETVLGRHPRVQPTALTPAD